MLLFFIGFFVCLFLLLGGGGGGGGGQGGTPSQLRRLYQAKEEKTPCNDVGPLCQGLAG